MSEQYRKNVHAMCDRLGLPNPIREEDLLIQTLLFTQRIGSGRLQQAIPATDMNRAGRLFFQEKLLGGSGLQVLEAFLTEKFRQDASQHFAELWHDAEKQNRRIILCLKHAYHIRVRWK